MRKQIILTLLIAFVLLAGDALAFTVTAPDNTFSVPLLGSKKIDITVSSPTADTITVNMIDPKIWASLSESQFTLQPGQLHKISLYVSPFSDTLQGLYKISLLFESLSTKELQKAGVFVSVEKSNIVSVEGVAVTGDLAPMGSARIDINVKNLKPVTVSNVNIIINISSPIKTVSFLTEIIPRLDPGQSVTVTKSIFFDKFTPPSTYSVDATALVEEESTRMIQTFYIASRPVLQKTVETISTFFGYGKRISIANYGNEAGTQAVSEPLSRMEYLFMTGDKPDAQSGDYYSWNVEDVVPGETRIIHYGIDYSPLIIFLLAFFVLLWVFLFKYKTVHVAKRTIQKKDLDEGEEFTISVEVHNNTGKKIDVSLADFVPSVFKVNEYQGPKPQKKKSGEGTELSWTLKDLNNRETRVLTYRIVPIFGIRGTIKLPKAVASFQLRGKNWQSRSMHESIGVKTETENTVMKRKK